MITMIDRFIKGLESLNMSLNELKIVLDLLKKLNGQPRIKLIDRLIMFNEFANNEFANYFISSGNVIWNNTFV